MDRYSFFEWLIGLQRSAIADREPMFVEDEEKGTDGGNELVQDG